jgi:hypothetical protein
MHCKRIFRPTFETNTHTRRQSVFNRQPQHGNSRETFIAYEASLRRVFTLRTSPAVKLNRISDGSLEVLLLASKEAKDPSVNISQHTAEHFSWNTSNFSSCTVFHFSQRMQLFTRTQPTSVRHKQQSNGFRSRGQQRQNQPSAKYLSQGSH